MVFVDLTVEIEDLPDFFFGFVVSQERGVAFLPEKLSGT
jgi:hypothetical protein